MIVHNLENWMLAESAINWIFNNIKDDSTILELGSGYGTELLSKKYKMISVEQDENWLNKFDTQYIYAPIENGFYSREALKKIPSKYDLLIVDGPTQVSGGRKGFIDNIDLFNLNCPILVDDVHREEEFVILENLSILTKRNYEIFDSGNKKFGIIK